MAKKALSPSCLQLVQAVKASLATGFAGTATTTSPDFSTSPIVVGCSGGADSLALSAAFAELAKKSAELARCVQVRIIDHDLQSGSAQVATEAADQVRSLGLAVQVIKVQVENRGEGLEAAARTARYQALCAGLEQPSSIYLAHTCDDQAESVLLGLARGSGARSLAGMAPTTPYGQHRLVRPLLGIRRAQTVQACQDWHLTPWVDPMNQSLDFLRVKVRNQAIPMLSEIFGSDVVPSLARTAQLARVDADELDRQARAQFDPASDILPIEVLTRVPTALSDRILRSWLVANGVDQPSFSHVQAVKELVTNWHGQRAIALPGGCLVSRNGRSLTLAFQSTT